MRIDTNKSGSAASRWFKNALCIGMVMGLSMSMGTAFADSDNREDREDRKEKHEKHKHKGKGKNDNIMTPFAQIAKLKVVKGEHGKIDYEATYIKAQAVATAIATYVATVNDTTSGYPADWIVGGLEGDTTLEESILRIPSPEFIDPDNEDLGVKKVNVIELCNKYYAAQALGVTPIAGTDTTLPDGYIHATALPCEVSTWNDDEHIYIDMLDPNAIFSIFFTDVLVSDDMQDPVFANAITALPVAVKGEIMEVVYNALDVAGIKYKAKDKAMGPKYKDFEDIFEVVEDSPNNSPYRHFAYTKTDETAFEAGESSAVAQAIIDAMSIHGEADAGTHDWDVEGILSEGSSWRSARHLPLGLPGVPEKNYVIEACSPLYAKMAMGTGMYHATALPCEISVQRVNLDESIDGSTEALVISYLDPYFMFGAMFSDISDEEMDDLSEVPGYIIEDLQYIVKHALETSGTELNERLPIYFTMTP